MPSRTPGAEPDPAAELLGRWQAHHAGSSESPGDDSAPEEPPSAPAAAPDPDPDPTPPPSPPVGGPRHSADGPAPGRRRPPIPAGADQTEAGREVVEALGITPPPEPDPDPEDEPDPEPEAPLVRRQWPSQVPGQTTDIDFPPRVLVRRVLGLLLLLLLPATAVAAYLAYDDPRTVTIGVAGCLLAVTLVVYAVRAGAAPAHLAIHSGQLEVVRGNTREVFDLTSRFTRMEVIGSPGRPGWRVLMARFGREPLVIDSSMVDPAAFTAALERHRRRT